MNTDEPKRYMPVDGPGGRCLVAGGCDWGGYPIAVGNRAVRDLRRLGWKKTVLEPFDAAKYRAQFGIGAADGNRTSVEDVG